jgi:hypothetical protein
MMLKFVGLNEHKQSTISPTNTFYQKYERLTLKQLINIFFLTFKFKKINQAF